MPTAVTRYVNTASTGGNGTTNATSGANAAYATLAAWHAAEKKNLVTADEVHTVICTGGQDTSAVDLTTTWVTDSTRFITITSNDVRSNTSFADGYRLYTTTVATVQINAAPYTVIEKIRLSAGNTSSSVDGIGINTATGVVIRKCWFRREGGSTFGSYVGIRLGTGGSNQTLKIYNNIFDTSGTLGASDQSVGIVVDYPGATATVSIFNNTVTRFNGSGTSGQIGISTSSGSASFDVRNNLVFNNRVDLGGDHPQTADNYNCTDDANTGTGWVNASPGATEATDWATLVNGYDTSDYTVKSGSALISAGLNNVSTDFSDDFAGNTRNNWEIGAFEFVSAVTGLTITSVTPSSFDDGKTGIVIAGSGFGASQGSSTVDIGGQAQTVTAWSNTSITITSARGSNSMGAASLKVTVR